MNRKKLIVGIGVLVLSFGLVVTGVLAQQPQPQQPPGQPVQPAP